MSSDENRELNGLGRSRRNAFKTLAEYGLALSLGETFLSGNLRNVKGTQEPLPESLDKHLVQEFFSRSPDAESLDTSLSAQSLDTPFYPQLTELGLYVSSFFGVPPRQVISTPAQIETTKSEIPITLEPDFRSYEYMGVQYGEATKTETTARWTDSKENVYEGKADVYSKIYNPDFQNSNKKAETRRQFLVNAKTIYEVIECRTTVEFRFDRKGNRQYPYNEQGELDRNTEIILPHEDDLAMRVMPWNMRGREHKKTRPYVFKNLKYCYDFGDRKHIWQRLPDWCGKRWNARVWLGPSPDQPKPHLIAVCDFLEYGPADIPFYEEGEIGVNPYEIKEMPMNNFTGHLPRSIFDLNVPYKPGTYIEGLRGSYTPPWTPLGQANDLRSWTLVKEKSKSGNGGNLYDE